MNPIQQFNLLQDRRRFLRGTTMGLGTAAFSSALLGRMAGAQEKSLQSGLHFPAKAKRVIFLFMAGAPSQIDLFDHKPELHKQFKQPLPRERQHGAASDGDDQGQGAIGRTHDVQVLTTGRKRLAHE